MSDVFGKEERSKIMRSVKSRNTKSIELALITLFKTNSITGWRRTYNAKGHPDFAFIKQQIDFFVDGCFCHGHECRNIRPADNAEHCEKKRERNIRHGREITELFEKRG